jgi:NitT/TauT family transport system substrate-binding protein
MKKLFIIFASLLLLAGAGFGVWRVFVSSKHQEIKISTNPWVGFTPFMYAQEKGWLEKTPFKFIWLVDLSDNARLFDKGFSQGFTATQYELLHFKNKEDLTTVFLIDQSYGADAILSNRTLAQIAKSQEKISIYLEMGSLSQDIFNTFIRENGLDKNKFLLVNSSQKSMEVLAKSDKPVILITYEPYVSQMKNKGLSVVASTRTLKTFHAIDALFAKKSLIQEHRDDFQNLEDIFERAQEQLRKDPKEFYTTIAGYLEGESYEDFMSSTHQIQWIESNAPVQITDALKNQNIPTDKLLR